MRRKRVCIFHITERQRHCTEHLQGERHTGILSSLSRCPAAGFLLQRGVPPIQHGFQAGFSFSIKKSKELVQQRRKQILTDICQVLIEIDHPQDTALPVQRVLFQQFLFKAEAQEHHILVVEVLHHCCASLLLANGVPMKQIQEWLGHSDFSTTANIYAHLDYSSKLTSAHAMERNFQLEVEKG